MADKIDDGGPAYPVNGPNGDYPGMSLRNWLAATLELGRNAEGELAFGNDTLEKLPGVGPVPVVEGNNYVPRVYWFAKAEAVLRYIHADAMLAASKGGA